MALPTIKSLEDIYDNMKSNMQTAVPTLTNWGKGSVIRAILQVTAAGIRLCYVVVEIIYFNLFPQDADREGLKREYEEWGLTWDDPDTEVARKIVLNKYQGSNVLGTKDWYENIILNSFNTVSEATCYPNARGPGTVNLYVTYRNSPLLESEVQEIQDYFDDPDNQPTGADILVYTAELEAV